MRVALSADSGALIGIRNMNGKVSSTVPTAGAAAIALAALNDVLKVRRN
jgi:hypothetical protein